MRDEEWMGKGREGRVREGEVRYRKGLVLSWVDLS